MKFRSITDLYLRGETIGDSQTLITACPKCQIHLKCAQSGTISNLKISDIYTYLKRRLKTV